MARIAGVNIPDNKHAVISLTYIFGVGKTTAQKLCDATGVKPDAKVKDLSTSSLKHFVLKWASLPSKAICVVKYR